MLAPPSPDIRRVQLDTCRISRLRDAPTGELWLSGDGTVGELARRFGVGDRT
jgi:hypothetical protein